MLHDKHPSTLTEWSLDVVYQCGVGPRSLDRCLPIRSPGPYNRQITRHLRQKSGKTRVYDGFYIRHERIRTRPVLSKNLKNHSERGAIKCRGWSPSMPTIPECVVVFRQIALANRAVPGTDRSSVPAGRLFWRKQNQNIFRFRGNENELYFVEFSKKIFLAGNSRKFRADRPDRSSVALNWNDVMRLYSTRKYTCVLAITSVTERCPLNATYFEDVDGYVN